MDAEPDVRSGDESIRDSKPVEKRKKKKTRHFYSNGTSVPFSIIPMMRC